MTAKQNAIKNIWFSLFVFITLTTFTLVFHFTTGQEFQGLFIGWLVIFSAALIYQLVLDKKYKITYRLMNYVYILSALLISMFGTVILKFIFKYDWTDWNWFNQIVTSLISSVVAFLINLTVWQIVKNKNMEHVNKDNELVALRKENEELKARLFEHENPQIQGEEIQKHHWWQFKK